MGRVFDALIRWSIDNRSIVLVAAVALFVAGVVSIGRAPIDVLPDFTPSIVVVQTEAPGMATTDVEQLVTGPLERSLLATPEVATVRSFSMPGLSVVTLTFDDGIDIYRARQLVTERVQIARTLLPQAAKEPQLAPIAAPIGAVFRLCLTGGGEDAASLRALRTFAEWTARPRLLAVPGVSQVLVLGGNVERFEVRPNGDRLREEGFTLGQLTDAVRASQAIAGAGFADQGEARIDVVADARIQPADAEAAISRAIVGMREGAPVRVADVADVVRGDEPPVGGALYDGKPAVFVQVTKLPWADTIQVSDRVTAQLADLGKQLPPGARFEPPIYRQDTFIRTSVWSVARAMLIGSVLIVVILIAFLRHGRLAIISLTTIPLSLVAALAVLIWTGASVNGMTLGGLAIAVGEVVDDAIVDVENVWRRLRENARRDAPRPVLDVIHDASVEVRSAVVYATLIVVLVLIPVLSLGSVAGRIFSPLAQSYILAIAVSLLVALTVTPAMCAWLLPRIATGEGRLPRMSSWLLERYRRVLVRVVEHPRSVLLVSAVAAVAALAALPLLGGRFLPEFGESTVIAHVSAVPGTSLREALTLAGRVDARIRPSEVEHVAAKAGRAELDEDTVPVNQLEINATLKPGDNREWDAIVAEIAQRIGHVPGLAFSVENFLGERIHEVLSGQTSPVVVSIFGPELGELRALENQAVEIMSTTPGLTLIAPEAQVDVPQWRVQPDRIALARYGVTERDVVEALVSWRQGASVTQVLGRGGRVIDVVVAGPMETRTSEALRDLPVDTPTSGPMPLSALARVDLVPAPVAVRHEQGERRVSIGADASGGALSRAVGQLETNLRRSLRLPEGYHLEVTGEAAARGQAAVRLLLIGLLVLAGIFVFLLSAFHSARDAGIVLLNFPLGLVGGVAAALLMPEGLSVAGLIGFVTLFGIVARNGIMLVAHKRHLDETEREKPPLARILQASEERLLPILMTAAAAGLGLLPLAISIVARGSELESPMAIIVLGGLLTSTSLNMLVLPTFYVWRERRTEARRTST